MDFQPSEIVGLIASFVKPKDVIAMKMTNKNMKWKLDRSSRMLPKPVVDVKLTEVEFSFLSLEMRLPAMGWTWISELVEAAPEAPETTPEAEDEKRGMVADFYMNKTEKRLKSTRGRFAWGLIRGLSLHLQFILNNMRIRTLTLHYPNRHGAPGYIGAVEMMMRENGTTVEELRIRGDKYPIGLIEACHPTSLFAEQGEPYTNSVFYGNLTIRKLQKFVMSPALTNDNELTLLSARHLELDFWGWSMVTINGIGTFLAQWLEGKREIWRVVIECGDEGICSYEEWTDMLSNLNKNQVVVTFHHDESSTLRRISDGVAIHAQLTPHYLKFEAFTVAY